MPPRDFTRPRDGFRFAFGGMKVNARPDALPMGKYPVAVNVRQYEDGTLRTRPGSTQLFSIPITDHAQAIRAYAALATDSLPRFLIYTTAAVYLDTGSLAGNLSGSIISAASMIPFRPNASPTPFMYVANGADYQKFSAPVGASVTQSKVGIAEPQVAPDASIATELQSNLIGLTYANGGTAGVAAGGTRFSDTIGAAVLKDPVSGSGLTSNYPVYSIQVTSTASYQKYAQLQIAAKSTALVLDVFPSLVLSNFVITGIFYFSGTTGHCVFVVSMGGPSPDTSENNPVYLAMLRRGAILKIGTENILIWSVTPGPDNTFAIETSTVNNHTITDTITLIPAIKIIQMQQTGSLFTPATGDAISDQKTAQAYQVTTGVGTETATIAGSNPFLGGPVASTASPFQPDDYLSFGFKIDVPNNLTEMKILFDVDDGSFTKNFYYYTVRAADLVSAIANAVTQLAVSQTVAQRAIIDEENAIESGNQGVTFSGAQGPTGVNTWIQIFFPIGELTRVGTDNTKSLLTIAKFQVLWNVTNTINVVQDNSFFIVGGFAPDVGDVGAPYRYRVRPRASATGVVGNPSPASRYGVNPRRQSVLVTLPSAAYDGQIDTWDVFRYGGGVTSWRFIGSTPSSNTTFIDNFSDDAALGGDELDFDNFEPWPSIDVPLTTTSVSVVGTTALVTVPTPTNVLGYLPGTLVRIGGQNVYTLQVRPILFSGVTYFFQFIENAGASTGASVVIQEPILARQFLPFMWGPDADGTVFACGDRLRPGTLYFAKPYAPDSAPDKFNQEIVQPTEPLLGGEIIDGLSYVGSSERWWRLYFQPENTAQRYSAVQEPFVRGLAAPFGHCTDGKNLYFWAKDGICRNSESLTDADLYTLFPHEGVPGNDYTYNGVTIKAPGYAFAVQFRLTYHQGYLYAVYADSNDVFHCLTADLRGGRVSWAYDQYSVPPTAIYHVEQPEESNSVLNPLLILGLGFTGPSISIVKQTDLTNDNGAPIACSLALNEFDGGDIRAPKQWGDHFIDLVPAANLAANPGISITPMSLGAGVVAPTVVPQGINRVRNPVSVGGIVVSDFMGLFLSWTDDFSRQAIPTQLFIWQPSFDIQPAKSISWQTFGTAFGLQGYGHIRQIAIAWVSTAPITLTIMTVDGQNPLVITLPSSGGVYTKQLFPVSANKGQLFIFNATSSAPFQIFEDDCEIHVGQWGRSTPYAISKNFGGMVDAQSPI